MKAWIEMFRALGNALFELLAAELAALGGEMAKSGRGFAIALGFFGAAVIVAFWTFGVFTYALIQIVALALPLWGAALTVTGTLVLVMAILVAIGVYKVKKLESPGVTAQRRVADMRDWWNHQLLPEVDRPVLDEGGKKGEEAP
ncbi:MAG: phage holin family protein [Acidobacteriota bacterium]